MSKIISVERVEWEGKIFAIILRKGWQTEGVNFLTAEDSPLQLGVLVHKEGKEIRPHIHRPRREIIKNIQEVLHIEQGKVEVDFYDHGKKIARSILNSEDTILFMQGGHGFKILEDSRIIEIKQGPYRDKKIDKELIRGGNDTGV